MKRQVVVSAEAVDAFVRSAVPDARDHRAGDARDAAKMLRQLPSLPNASIHAASAAGDVRALRAWLKRDKNLAVKTGGAMNWLPLCYVCFSKLLRHGTPRRRRDFLACARLLLRAGADANSAFTNDGDGVSESVLYGAAGVANDPALTRLLLRAGADVNDGETLYHTAEFRDHSCLKLVLAKKPGNISFCMCHKMDDEDPAGVKLFLRHGADPNLMIQHGAGEILGLRPLHFAILRNRSPETVRVLLQGGADPRLPASNGMTPYAFAMVLGRRKIASELKRHGGATTLSPRESFLAACTAARPAEARKILRANANIIASLSPQERALLPMAAAEGNLHAVTLMLKLGFPIDTPGPWAGSALHQAAWAGHVPVVKFLLRKNASLTCRQCFGGDVLQTAIHGASHAGHKNGAEIVRMIVRAMRGADFAKYLDDARKRGHPGVIAVLEKAAPLRHSGEQ